MTIKELIEHLKQYPENLEVKIQRTYQDERDEVKFRDEQEPLTAWDIEQEGDCLILS